MKPQLTPEAFNAAPALIPALSMLEFKKIFREFRPIRCRRRRFSSLYRTREQKDKLQKWRGRELVAGRLLSVDKGPETLKLSNRAFYDYVMERLSLKAISSIKKYDSMDRHEGNEAMNTLVGKLLSIYAHYTGQVPELSRADPRGGGGPFARFVVFFIEAYANKLPSALKEIDPSLHKSLLPTSGAMVARIKRSPAYREMRDPLHSPDVVRWSKYRKRMMRLLGVLPRKKPAQSTRELIRKNPQYQFLYVTSN